MKTTTNPTVPAVGGTSERAKSKVSVWLVDDNTQLRMLVGDLLALETDIDVVRHFSGPDELLSTLATKPGPDVILLDIQMGRRNGLDAVRPVKLLSPGTRVLMFTTCFNPAWRERALLEGASDYLLKTDGITKVAERIRSPADDKSPKPCSSRRQPPSPNPLPANCSSLWRRALGILRPLRN